jgi:mannosyl-oligosaccharide alpha-1,2-mannosidase
MPGFRRWGKSKFQQNPTSYFKLLAAVLVITFYLLIKEFASPPPKPTKITPKWGAQIQFADWKNGTDRADKEKAAKVREAMKYTFWKYRENAWGYDGILPVSGGKSSSGNGWGAFIIDSATTLAIMALWDELALSVEHIVTIDFTKTDALVDPSHATNRYLGGLVSLVDLYDAGVIPENIISKDARDLILEQAVTLANALGSAYDTPTGMPWPRVDFNKSTGVPDPLMRGDGKSVVDPAHTGSFILENRALTRLTGNEKYTMNSTLAWARLVWSKWIPTYPGIIEAPINVVTGEPVGRERHWDGGHDVYYESLVKMTILAPPSDGFLTDYKSRFLQAAESLRKWFGTRSAPAPKHAMQHLFLGRMDANWYLNRQSHLACFAPGTILLASKFYDNESFKAFAMALLEGCHHAYSSTPSSIGPESWSWTPKFGFEKPVYSPGTARQKHEWETAGFWSVDPQYKGRPEFVESVFYAWRITGEARFREWAWSTFEAIEKHCKASYGYAQLADVYKVRPEDWHGDGTKRWIDVQESYWAAETLKYLWLTFSDIDVTSLDRWVFSTGGHVFRMIR